MLPPKKVTILLHTRNRPDFLYRAIRNINSNADWNLLNLVILDGSDVGVFEESKKKIKKFLNNKSTFLLHDSDPESFLSRISRGLILSNSKYVVLAADDDLYCFDWLGVAIEHLENDKTLGVVYGNILKFSTQDDTAFAPIEDIMLACYRRPSLAWLEGESIEERLNSLGRDSWATAGWYSLQRREILEKIVNYANDHKIEGVFIERLLIFMQSALCRTRKIEKIFLCRQYFSNESREPISYKDNIFNLKKLECCFEEVLRKECGVPIADAQQLIKLSVEKEYFAYKAADNKKILRFFVSKFPRLRNLVSYIRSLFSREGSLLEDRLTMQPTNEEIAACTNLIKSSVRNNF